MTTTRRGLVIRSLVSVASVAAILVIAATAPRVAEAHAELERSNPAPDSVIPKAPDELEIWFTQELFRREGANTIVVEGPEGRADDGNLVIDSTHREHLTVGLLPDLPAGEYRVSWTSLSAIDGDAAEGSFVFTIDPTAPAPTPPPAETTETPEATLTESPAASATVGPEATTTASSGGADGASFPTWALIAAASILGSAGLGAWALLRSPAADEV